MPQGFFGIAVTIVFFWRFRSAQVWRTTSTKQVWRIYIGINHGRSKNFVEWFHLLEFQITKTIVFGDVMVAM
jgi:hypothetical protein